MRSDARAAMERDGACSPLLQSRGRCSRISIVLASPSALLGRGMLDPSDAHPDGPTACDSGHRACLVLKWAATARDTA